MSRTRSPLPRPLTDALLLRALRSTLVGRDRSEGRHEEGRFTSDDARRLLARAWQIESQLAPDLRQPTFGARMNVWLASLTLGFQRALLEEGMPAARADQVVAATAWRIYRMWGRVPWFVARLGSRDPLDRLRICTNLFRHFPFNPPAYVMEDVKDSSAVCFRVRKCPVAEFFASRNASEVCVHTWCALDFPLAEMWGGRLERTSTLAGGAEGCDFRWLPERSELVRPAAGA